MITYNFTIIVIAYNRAEPLNRLLISLNNIITKRKDINLVVSIDNGGTREVNEIAEKFCWNHGEKSIHIHQKKLGLKKHFIWAGDQTEKYENVLFVEDDLYVSPYVTDFVNVYLDKYKDDERIAGASLYNPILCEFTKCKFYQFQDGYDNFFLQHPYWGNIWSRQKWREFKKWLYNYKYNEALLPPNVRLWGSESFKRIYIQYLIECKKYIVYPRNSYVTNMGVKGLHNDFDTIQYQVVMEHGNRTLRMSSFDESESIYDAFFEISPNIIKKYNSSLEKYDFAVDLHGVKDSIKEDYSLTCKPTKNIIQSFSGSMRPIEENIITNIPGHGINFTKTRDIINAKHIRTRIREEEKCTMDILKNYPIRTKHLIFALLFALTKKKQINKDGKIL